MTTIITGTVDGAGIVEIVETAAGIAVETDGTVAGIAGAGTTMTVVTAEVGKKEDIMSRNNSQNSLLDTILLGENFDIISGFVLLIIGLLVSFVNHSTGMIMGLCIGIYFFFSFLIRLNAGEQYYERDIRPNMDRSKQIPPTSSAPITDESTIADKIKSIHIATNFKCPSCGATVNPTDTKCKSCSSFLVASANLPKPALWGDAEIGQSIHVTHPQKGRLTLSIRCRIYYGELWQAQMKSHVPWTLTGNYYVGLGFENGMFLLNWQSRFYLLESNSSLTDKEINQNFAQPAREFAASNQSKDVHFAYNKAIWEIEDIGRFRIEFSEGEGTKADAGAVGRFIHANQGNQALIVEDYQSGTSGVDNLWMGYKIEEKDIEI